LNLIAFVCVKMVPTIIVRTLVDLQAFTRH